MSEWTNDAPEAAEADELAPQAASMREDAESMASARWRGVLVALLVVVACVVAPLAGTAVWLRNQITDTDRYVRTIEPLADNADIQAAVAAQITTALFTRVDIQQEAEDALPPRADFLAVPLANGIERSTEDATLRVLESERFQELWLEVNRIAHAQLVHVLTGGGDVLQTEEGKVVLDLAPVLAVVKEELASRGIEIFERVPEGAVSTSFVLTESENLETAQQGLKALETLAIVLPVVLVVCLVGALALSRNRRRTLLRASLGIAASMLALGLLLLGARSLYVAEVAGPGLPDDAARAFFDITVKWLRVGIRAIGVVALLVALGAWVTGPSRAAAGIRSRFGSGVGWLAGETGVRSSGAGRWVGENKRALRIASIAVPAVVFFLWSMPTPAVLLSLIVVALLLLLAVEVVGARPPAPRT